MTSCIIKIVINFLFLSYRLISLIHCLFDSIIYSTLSTKVCNLNMISSPIIVKLIIWIKILFHNIICE
nr:MAG TPA: hypothetical protein [Bacteriophage sp.]